MGRHAGRCESSPNGGRRTWSETVALALSARGVASARPSATTWIAGRVINVIRLAEPSINRRRFDYRHRRLCLREGRARAPQTRVTWCDSYADVHRM
eukprot:3917553-Prymnesium_polylepis.1